MKTRYELLKNKYFRHSFVVSLFLLLASLIINFYAGMYATERASNPVTDIILSNTRAYDLDGIFVYGSWVMVSFIVYVCLRWFNKTPFILKSIALFVFIRAIFITLTHIGPFPTQEVMLNPSSFLSYFVFGGDLFFSGHTGLPFLLALVFWDEKWLRIIFLIATATFAVVVLFAHLHYTIDVVSAFFISYGIYHMALTFFKKEHEFFLSDSVII